MPLFFFFNEANQPPGTCEIGDSGLSTVFSLAVLRDEARRQTEGERSESKKPSMLFHCTFFQ